MRHFRAGNVTRIWKIEKRCTPESDDKSVPPDERFIQLKVVFSMEQSQAVDGRGLMEPLMDGHYPVQAVVDPELYERYLGRYAAFLDYYANRPDPALSPPDTPSREDVFVKVWLRGSGFVKHLARANVYVFEERLRYTHSVRGIIAELELLQAGVNESNTADPYLIRDLLGSLYYHLH